MLNIPITITLSDPIPHDCESCVLKGIISKLISLMGPGTTALDYIPKGHEEAFKDGEAIAEQIVQTIKACIATSGQDVNVTIPGHIPHGRKSSILKGIIHELTPLAKRQPPGSTPEGHKRAIQIGEDIAERIEQEIESHVDRSAP